MITEDSVKSFFEENKSTIIGGLVAVLVIAGGLYAYFNIFKQPRELEAQNELYKAEQFLARDSFARALKGVDELAGSNNFMGFAKVSQEYSGTAAGNLAAYYAGVASLNLGDYDLALDYLNDFSSDEDNLQAQAYTLIGDATSEKGDMESALSFYKKASKQTSNATIASFALQKAALLSHNLGKLEDAKGYYELILEKYPKVAQQINVEKALIALSKK